MLESGCKARPHCPLPGGSRSWAGAVVVCLSLCGLAGILPCLRADSSPLAAQRRDLEASVRARSLLLLHQPPLRIEGLRVDVRDGVASVEGDVPSEAELQKALGLLQNVRGIREVKSSLRIAAAPSAREATPLPLPDEKPMQTRAQASPIHELPSAPAVQVYSTLPPPPRGQSSTPAPPLRYSSVPSAPAYTPSQPEADWPRRGRTAAIPTGRLAQPAPPPVGPSSVRLLPPSDLAPSPAATSSAPVSGVREQVERIRQGNEHFRFLQAEVHGDTIVVHGQNGASVMEMARQLTSLPGIKHVIIKVHPAPQ